MCVCVHICVLKMVVIDVRVKLYISFHSLHDTPSKTKASRFENETRAHKGTRR